MEKERTIEFLIGLGVIIFVLLLVVIFLNLGDRENKETDSDSSDSGTTIINNYYYGNNYNLPENSISGNVVYKCDEGDCVVYKRYYDDEDYCNNKFSSYGRQSKNHDGFNYVDTYSVFVKNRDNVGKYFKVIFYFEDKEDYEESQSIIKYIGPGEVEKFVYRDVHFERYNYEKWGYEVFSQDCGF
jgi:hypothetical protein